ncbi:MAG: outer membrane beta-barrel protein, partial [Bacteroidia bacterium]
PFAVLLFCLCLPFLGYSQNRIDGKIIDDKQSPVPFCALALLNAADSSLVKGNITTENGEFVFEGIPAGRYFLKANNVGFKEFLSTVVTIDSLNALHLEPFVLSPDAVNLKEVSIAVFKPTVEFKKGTIILNAENDLVARGNTVLDLLKRLPGVIVDAQNNISINGNGNVRFLMDGRLQQIPASQMITILSGMSAETIKSLELIKNPPARYDAAGMAGLINIVTKKATLKGISGFVAQSYSQGKRARYNTVTGLNYKNNKFSFFSTLNVVYATWEDESELDRVLNTTATTNAFNASGAIVDHRKTFSLNAGMEYEFTKKTSVGIYFNDNLNNTNPVQIARTQVFQGDAFNYSSFVYRSDNQQNYNVPTVNLSVLHKFDSLGSQLQYQGDYANVVGDEKKLIDNHFYDAAGNEIDESSYYNTLIHNDYKISNHKLDYTTYFKNQLSLEAGAKGGFVNINSSSNLQLHNSTAGFYNGDTTFNNNYEYNERILAAYATLSKSFEKAGFTAGVRAEQTNIDAMNKSTGYHLTRNYTNLFPSGSVDLKLNKKNTVSAVYSYRIDRPSYDMMNPVRIFNDQLNYSVGNSELKPQYTHYITMDYNFNNFMTTSISYHRTNDFTFYYTYTKNNSQVNIDTIFNFPIRNNFVISEFIQKQIKWYNIQFYGNFVYRNFVGNINGESANSQTTSYYLSLYNEFRLPKDFKITLNAYYSSKFYDGIQTYYPMSNISVIVNKSFFNNKLNVSLGVFDILWRDYGSHSSELSNQYYYYRQKPDTRRFRINLLWKFGKMRIEQKLNSKEDNSRFSKGK